MTLVLLSFLLLQLFQCSLRFLSGLRPVGRPGAKGFAKLRRIFLPCKLFKTFFVLPPFSDFLKIYSEEYLLFPISAPTLFSELSRLAAVALRRPFLKSECKGRHSPHSLQIFQKLFYTQSTLMIVRETFKRLYRIQLQAPRIFTVFSNNFYANIFFTVKAKEMRQITEPAKPTETANNAPHDHHPKTSHTTRIRQKHIYINIKFRPLKKKISPEISHLKRKPIY